MSKWEPAEDSDSDTVCCVLTRTVNIVTHRERTEFHNLQISKEFHNIFQAQDLGLKETPLTTVVNYIVRSVLFLLCRRVLK